MVDIVLLIIAAVCFALDALRVDALSRVNLTALGLLCWVLVGLL